MGITYNSGAVNAVSYNSNALQRVTYNGNEVWGAENPSVFRFAIDTSDNPELYLAITESTAGCVSIDWGDGSPVSSVDAEGFAGHEYSASGNYDVKVKCAAGETWEPGVMSEGAPYPFDPTGFTRLISIRGGDGMLFSNSSVTTSGVFQGYTALTSVVVGDGVTSVGRNAFSGCTGLQSVTIPNGVSSIGDYAFNSCSSLAEITLPSGLSTVGNGAFIDCTNLETVIITPGVSALGASMFQGCTSLETVIIPSNVTTLGNGAFSGCTDLASVVFSANVAKIPNTSFSGCTSLESFTITLVTPPTWGIGPFNNVPADCAIYVPSASVATYQAASGWSSRAAYIQAIP